MEGPLDLQRCLKEDSACTKGCGGKCPVHASLAVIQADFTKALREVNFAGLVGKDKEER